MAANSSFSFLPKSGNTGGNMSMVPKSPARSRFSKALPTPPPVIGKLLHSRSSSRPSNSAATVDKTPSLPPLPPASSALLYSPVQTYIPTTPASSAYPSVPQPPPKSSARTMPGTITSAPSPSSSPFPQLPPQPPTKQISQLPQHQEQEQPRQQQPPIRRRPVASSISTASNDSNRSSPLAPSVAQPLSSVTPPAAPSAAPVAAQNSVVPRLPDLPSLNSSSNNESHPSQPSLPELPVTRDTDAISETQSQTKTVRAPPSPSRAASISSILSAYSEESSPPAGLSSSTSDGTVSTNNSSYMAASSPLQPLPRDENQPVFVDAYLLANASKLNEVVHTPLSYLLEGDYADDIEDESEATPSVTSPKTQSGDYDPFSDEYYNYTPLHKSNARTSLDSGTRATGKDLSAAPPPISKAQTVLPPRSTSLKQPLTETAKTVTTPAQTSAATIATSYKSKDILPPLPAFAQTSSSELWKRRSEKAESNISVSELNLKPSPAVPNTTAETSAAGAAAAAANTDTGADAEAGVLRQQPLGQQNENPPVAPSKDGYIAYSSPLPPPKSPLPPPPPRSALGQLQPPKSPLQSAGSNGASSLLSAPSLRLGLPGRDIQPSCQESPTATSTALQAGSDAELQVSAMGTTLTKLETKVGSSLKRKEVKTLPSAPRTIKETQPSPSPLISKPQPSPPPPFQRLPTPEYDDEDGGNRTTNDNASQSKNGASLAASMTGVSSSSATVVNVPVSPAASPAGSTTDSPVPSPLAKDSITSIETPRPTPPPQAVSSFPGRDIGPVKSSVQSSVPAPEASEEPPQPPQQQFAPRTSSRKASISTPSMAQVPMPQQPSHTSYNQYVESTEPSVSEASSQVTIRPDAEDVPTGAQKHQQSAYTEEQQGAPAGSSVSSADLPLAPGMPPLFPSGYMSNPVTRDTVFAAPPPSAIQFKCLQHHRDMYRDRNVNYPLSCQTCQTFERSMRWRCKWCYVRMCTSCRDVLHTHAKGDLTQLMAYIKEGHPPGNGQATSGAPVDGDSRAVMNPMPPLTELPAIQEL